MFPTRNSSDHCSFRIHVKLTYIQWNTPVSDWKQSRDPLEADCKVTVFTHDPTDAVCLNRSSVEAANAQLWFSLGVSQYDPRFGDAFWNSSKYNMVSYLLRMMTSWAIVVNVWYLPPMTIQVQLNTVLTWTYHYNAVTHWPKEQLWPSLRIYHVCVWIMSRKVRMQLSLPTGSNLPSLIREDCWTWHGEVPPLRNAAVIPIQRCNVSYGAFCRSALTVGSF